MADELTWWEKAGIGALGGLGLAILKLIDAKFYLGSVSSVEPAAAYLTYFCYMLLGSLVAVFFTDHELPAPKMKRSSFVLGLLAPSVLLAIVTQPIKPGQLPDEGLRNVPKIGSWLIPSAHAQEPTRSPEAPVSELPQIISITKADLAPSFSAALLAAVGRKGIVAQYAYVVGTTTDKQKALETAQTMNSLFLTSYKGNMKLNAQIIKPEGAPNYYVTVGNTGTPDLILALKSAARSAAVTSLTATPTQDAKQAASLLLEGRVLQARSLVEAGNF